MYAKQQNEAGVESTPDFNISQPGFRKKSNLKTEFT